MDEPSRTQGEENKGLARERRKYKILFIVKFLLGFVLLILGGLAVQNTDKSDGSGPPYYFGAFLVGCIITIIGIMDLYIMCLLTSNDQSTLQTVVKCIRFEAAINFISLPCGVIGIIFDVASGVRKCELPESCHYTVNIETNRNIAIAILVFLIVSCILSIASCVLNLFCSDLGFSGAVIQPAENTTVHPIVRYYPDNQGATCQHPTFHQDQSVNQLQEQNRLLREQIALQQQQVQLMQQQHQQLDASSTMPLPPPSYESCLQDPV